MTRRYVLPVILLDSENNINRHVSQRMRQLGRLLIVRREHSKNPNITLQDYITPTQFDEVVLSTKQLCYEDRETPSLALKVGQGMKDAIAVLRGQVMRRTATAPRGDVKYFKLIFESE